MGLLSRALHWLNKFIEAKGWDQYPIESIVAIYEDTMSYRLSQHTRDVDTGITHIKDAIEGTLSFCAQGFALLSLDMTVKHTAVPTCVFCIAGMRAGLPQWRFLPKSNMYRRVIEEHRDG